MAEIAIFLYTVFYMICIFQIHNFLSFEKEKADEEIGKVLTERRKCVLCATAGARRFVQLCVQYKRARGRNIKSFDGNKYNLYFLLESCFILLPPPPSPCARALNKDVIIICISYYY